MLKATGQEAGSPGNYWPFNDNTPGLQPGSRVNYEQHFAYDRVGNMLSLEHCHNNVTVYTRQFELRTGTNQLQIVTLGTNAFIYNYDPCGNMVSRDLATSYAYNQAGQLIFTKVQAGGIPSVVAFYTYNAEGQRTKKVVWKDNGKYEATIYLDGFFEKTYTFSETAPLIESQTYSHMVVGDRKLFSYRTGDLMGDLTPADKWTMQDALGSVSCTTNGSGTVLSVECYYAFGETAFGSYTKKRYRYCGKERDGETGLYYYGARYYDAWTCRFVSVDPLADKYAYLSPYNYAGNNPISYMDVDGMQSEANETSPDGRKAGNPESRSGAESSIWKRYKEQSPSPPSTAAVGDNTSVGPVKANEKKSASLNKHYAELHPGKSSTIGDVEAEKEPAGSTSNPPEGAPTILKWITKAYSQLGQTEIKGDENNPVIIDYHSSTKGKGKTDELAWCSSFVNWSLTESGITGTNSSRAFDWKDWGEQQQGPVYGAVAIMDFSHVGFVVGKNRDGSRIFILGGNQGKPGAVTVTSVNASSIIAYRFPTGQTASKNLPVLKNSGKGLNYANTR